MKPESTFQYWVFNWDGVFYKELSFASDNEFEKWNETEQKPRLRTIGLMVFTNNPTTTYAKATNVHEAIQKATLEPFERSIRGLKNILDIIFTHEKGQSRMTLSLDESPNVFLGKDFFESRLKWMWQVANSLRGMGDEIRQTPKLFKISTRVIEPTKPLPDWYKEFDGKFYYND